MRGDAPVVIGRPFRVRNPYRIPHFRVERDWPKILSSIPIGWGLKIPVPLRVVSSVLWRLKMKGLVKRFEYVSNQTEGGGCIIYHLNCLVGKPFALESPKRRRYRRPEYWDQIFKEVLSGKPVIVDTRFNTAYQAASLRIGRGEIPPRSIRFHKIMRKGTEYVRLKKR